MKQYKSRDKITQKMTRDGLIEVNETQQTAERISKREQDADFQKSPEQQAAQDGTQLQGVASQTSPLPHAPGASPARDTATAERVMEHIEAAQTRRASKKAVHKAQEEVTVQTTSSRLQFTEEELAVPELECYSGYIDELTNHTYTFDNSFAPVCNLQTGAFCILSKNFFKKFLKPTSILKCVGLRVYERGHFKLHRFRGSERR